jgi:hypothetical protein
MLPERERFAAFREDFARRVMAMDIIDHSGGGRPRVDITPPFIQPDAQFMLSAERHDRIHS